MNIYGISGLGADERVFKYLTLEHKIIPVNWLKPKKHESIEKYSKRLLKKYNIDKDFDFIIIGVSFGGLIAVEISKFCNPNLTILISSIETRNELSKFLQLLKKLRIIRLIPTQLFNPPRKFAHFLFGTKKTELLNSILDDTDLGLAKWAVTSLINWKNSTKLNNIIKIKGNKDKLLPPKGNDEIIIEGGEHFMIVDKADEISEIINKQLKMKFWKKSKVHKPTISLKELNPENLSEIKVTYLMGKSRITNYYDILTIKYSGKYRFGSAGNDDAQFMYAKGEYGINSYEPMGAILDLTELEYEWGDMMDLVFSIGSDSEFPIVIVIGEKCQKAFGTLIHGIDSKEPATTTDWIFDDFEIAWKHIEEKLEEQRNFNQGI